MRASQPSARSCSATGSVLRAAFCIGCGLGSLTSPTLAQAPAPTTEFHSEPTQPWQAGKPAEFRQPRPDTFAKPGNEGAGQEASWNAERKELRSLLLEEKRLLVDYGPDHPDVCSIRERIQIVREQLAQHPPAPPPTALAPISVQTPYRGIPSTSNSPRQTPPLPLPPVRSQFLQPAAREGGAELIRPAGFSTAGNPIRDSGTAPASVVKTNDKDMHPSAIASAKPSAQALAPPHSVGDSSARQPSLEQPRAKSFFETGFGQLIGIVGAVLLGVLIHLIALVLILRRYSAHLARVSRVERVDAAAVGFAGEEADAQAQTVAAIPATTEVPHSSTAESFDIGPTYAEEMRQKQEAKNQQEQAVLRHIFELNMQMREQLRLPSGGAA